MNPQMSDTAAVLKNRVFLILIFVVLAAAVAAAVTLYHQNEKAGLSAKVAVLSQDKSRLSQDAQKMQSLLKLKEEALALSQSQNFAADLAAAQESLKEAKENLAAMIREKSGVENSNLILDNRLKNTTSELTRTLDELKKARETLGSIDGQYRTKIAQLTENMKSKDQQLLKFQQQLKDKEGSVTDIRKREIETSDAVRQYQKRVSELEKTVSTLNKSLEERDRALSQASKTGPRPQVSSASFERERFNLEKQISDSSAKLFDQQEQLKDLEKKVSALDREVSGKELQLAKREQELKERVGEIEILKNEVLSLRSVSSQSSETAPMLTETQKQLQEKVRQLERERRSLEDKLEVAQQRATGKTEGVKDIFADRNFRILTETLVKKEEQIKEMEKELGAFKADEKLSQGSVGLKEQRLKELELLVNALTKQLGEYAGMLEKKDGELKISQERIASLAQDVEAQKIASIAIQRALADARTRQEKTFQSLTQVMNMNTNGGPADTSVEKGSPDVEKESLNMAAPDEDIQKRAEELRKKVEVLLESKN